jgi:hypothetical protein
MKRNTAYVTGAIAVLACVVVEILVWGPFQGFATLGFCFLLIFPAVWGAPRRNRRDRIWIIALLKAIFTGGWRRAPQANPTSAAGEDLDPSASAAPRNPSPPAPIRQIAPHRNATCWPTPIE